MQAFLMVIHVMLAVALIGLILIQHGKGADAGAAFGSGASATVFGARGSGSFLTRITTFLAIGFFANSMALAYLSAQQPADSSVVDKVQIEAPAAMSSEQGTAQPGAAEPVAPSTPADVPAVD